MRSPNRLFFVTTQAIASMGLLIKFSIFQSSIPTLRRIDETYGIIMKKAGLFKFKHSEHTLALNHLFAFSVIYCVYAQQVCPILSTKQFVGVWLPALTVLGAQFALRLFFHPILQGHRVDKCLRRSFWFDYSSFLFGAVALTFANELLFNLPLESHLKVSVSFLALGFYITLDLSLNREYQHSKKMVEDGEDFPSQGRSMPFTQKFLFFSILNLLVLATASGLVVYKDVLYAAKKGSNGGLTEIAIMTEVFFVVMVLCAYIVRVIFLYSRNMKFSIECERNALSNVVNGKLDEQAPILSGDEFGQMARLTNKMTERLRTNIAELEATQEMAIRSLVSLAAKRDNETGAHLERTQMFIVELAESLCDMGMYPDTLCGKMIKLLHQSAPLHDIGKVGIPDHILQKPGKLTPAEFEIMKTHAQMGADALRDADQVSNGASYLSVAREIAETHHERWDGKGYPNGLAGREIPLSGRLMAVADVYDALRSKRAYKSSMSHAKAVSIINDGRGSHFDPDIVDAFNRVAHKFEIISAKHLDDEDQPVAVKLGKAA